MTGCLLFCALPHVSERSCRSSVSVVDYFLFLDLSRRICGRTRLLSFTPRSCLL
jgi:hypothetical protein